MKHWQERMLDDLIAYLEPHEDVLGLLLFGSLSKPEFQADDWSDIDVLVVVKGGKLGRFFPAVDWIDHFGRLYTYSQSSDDFKYTTRACFENLNRVDFVFTTEEKLSEVSKWSNIPFSSGVKILFSHSEVVNEIVNQTYCQQETVAATPEQFIVLVRNFRFKSMLAVYKVVRNDLLIAVHLALELIRECSVLGMMLRDRATGTNIHKDGGIGNQVARQLEITQRPFTPIGILDSITASSEVFERLAYEWSDTYADDRQPLLNWIEKAKNDLQDKDQNV